MSLIQSERDGGSTSVARPRDLTLFRFPGPLVLARILDGEAPSLHHEDAPRVFIGDLSLWSWPGVDEFGALAIFGAERLAPRPADVDGWYVIDPVSIDPDAVLYVPDRQCARAVSGAADAGAARRRLPPHHAAAVGEARRAMERYDAVSRAVVEVLEALDADPRGLDAVPEAWRADASTPLHMLPPGRRDALARALRRAVRRLGPTHRRETP